jgi:hypothetical protein
MARMMMVAMAPAMIQELRVTTGTLETLGWI